MSGKNVSLDLEATSFSDALVRLSEEGADRVPRQVTRLHLDAIRTATVVFQPRDVESAFLLSDQHIKTLAEAIKDAEGHVLTALVVWWSGQHWYVIDGHHRLQAYRLVKGKVKLPEIPVKAYDGTLNEAIRQSAALNCRDKLRMSKEDKLERAWKLVCLPERWTKASVREATGISERTVANMRKVRADLVAEELTEDILSMTWAKAKRNEGGEIDEDWEEQQAINLQKRLVKGFGTKLIDHPEITARALELYSARLPGQLIAGWRSEALAFAEECQRYDEDCDF